MKKNISMLYVDFLISMSLVIAGLLASVVTVMHVSHLASLFVLGFSFIIGIIVVEGLAYQKFVTKKED